MPELALISQRIAQAGRNLHEHGRQAIQHVVQRGKDVKQTVQESPQILSDTLRPERAKKEAREFHAQFDIEQQLKLSPTQADLFRSAFALELLRHTPAEFQAKTVDGEGNEVYDMNSQNDRGQQKILMEMVGQTRQVIAGEISTEIGKKMVRSVRGAGRELADIYLLRLQENVQDYEIADAVRQIAQRMGVYDLQQYVADIWDTHVDTDTKVSLRNTEIPLREPDHAIDELAKQVYTQEAPRTSIMHSGEAALIRPIDTNDREDMRRVQEMQRVENSDFFYRAPDNDSAVIEQHKRLGEHSEDAPWMLFGIAGNERVGKRERGELQGQVYVYEVGSTNKGRAAIKDMAERGLIPAPREGQEVFEVAYVKYPDAPPGQIASGLRQVCERIKVMDRLRRATEEVAREYGIDPTERIRTTKEIEEETGDMRIRLDRQMTAAKRQRFDARVQEKLRLQLVRAEQQARQELGIQDVGQLSVEAWQKYDAKLQEVLARFDPIITATISPRNPESMLAATAAGFQRAEAGMIEGQSDPQDYLYVLNWDRQQQIRDTKVFPNSVAKAK